MTPTLVSSSLFFSPSAFLAESSVSCSSVCFLSSQASSESHFKFPVSSTNFLCRLHLNHRSRMTSCECASNSEWVELPQWEEGQQAGTSLPDFNHINDLIPFSSLSAEFPEIAQLYKNKNKKTKPRCIPKFNAMFTPKKTPSFSVSSLLMCGMCNKYMMPREIRGKTQESLMNLHLITEEIKQK